MKYALLVYASDAWDTMSESEREQVMGEYAAVGQAPGVLGGEQLMPAPTATTVRVQDGEVLLTDGPFVEAKEYFGGFYLLEAENLDAAVALAARVPAARLGGGVEIRPLVEMPG